MCGVVEQHPVQSALVSPFGELGEFAAHEQHFYTYIYWMRGHVTIQGAQAAELILIRGRHFGDQRAFAVHDLVVRKRQNVIFRERIHEREGDLVMHVLTEERVGRAVAQHVVHPAHVPLKVEAETAVIAGLVTIGHAVDSSAIIMTSGWSVRMNSLSKAQKVDRFKIFASAVDVGPPLVLAVVVKVKHGSDPRLRAGRPCGTSRSRT